MILDYIISYLCHMPYTCIYITISRFAFGLPNSIEITLSHLFDEVILRWSDKLNLGENPATLMRQGTRSLLGSNPIPIPISLQFRFPQNATTRLSALGLDKLIVNCALATSIFNLLILLG